MNPFFLFLPLFLFLNACFLGKVADSSPLKILSFSPSERNVDSLESIEIIFSKPLQKNLFEKDFLFQENEITKKGSFRWKEGKSVIFTPFEKFQDSFTYVFLVPLSVKDTNNNNLKEEFRFEFTVQKEIQTLVLENFNLAEDQKEVKINQELIFSFSHALDERTLRSGILSSPSIEGFFSLSEDKKKVTWKLFNFLKAETDYTITIEKMLKTQANNTLEKVMTKKFTTEKQPKTVLKKIRTTRTNIEILDTTTTYSLEKDDEFILEFENPVSQEELSFNFLSLTGGGGEGGFASYIKNSSWSADFKSQTVGFSKNFEIDAFFTFKVQEKTYQFKVDAPSSKYLKIHSLGFSKNFPLEPVQELSNNLLLTIGTPYLNTVFDVFVEHSSTSEIRLSDFLLNYGFPGFNEASILRVEKNPPGTLFPSVLDGRKTTLFRFFLSVTIAPNPSQFRFTVEKNFSDTLNNPLKTKFETDFINKT